jgi:hypothetical protein
MFLSCQHVFSYTQTHTDTHIYIYNFHTYFEILLTVKMTAIQIKPDLNFSF